MVALGFLGLFLAGMAVQDFSAVLNGGSHLSRHARAQVMLDMQLQSMRAYNPANFGQDPGLHFITQRYALLTTSLLLLNADYQVCTYPSICTFKCSQRLCRAAGVPEKLCHAQLAALPRHISEMPGLQKTSVAQTLLA